MSSVARKLLQVQPSAADDTGDDDFANVVLLLDGDGTSGDENSTFTCENGTSGASVSTFTEVGDVVQGSFSPYGDNWSVYFDSSAANEYLQVADSNTFDATTSLCIEAWFYMTTAPGDGPNAHAIVSKWVSTTPGQRTVFIDVESTGLRVAFDIQGASNPVTIATDGGAISLGEWHHVAATWDGSTYRAFLDGVLEGSVSNSSAPIASSQVVRVGYNTNAHYFGGYISNVRWVTNGGAVYTSNFAPPTSPLTAISGTALLLNSANRFIDESTNNHTVTINGSPKVTPFSPFKNDEARDITVYGGSAYFDGSSYLHAPTNHGIRPENGGYTIEGWFYATKNTTQILFDARKNSNTNATPVLWITNGDDLNFWHGYGTSTASNCFNLNEWVHVVANRDGSTTEVFCNGVRVKNFSNTGTIFSFEQHFGARWDNGAKLDEGYLADWRIEEKVKLYTGSTITVPTAPVGVRTTTDSYMSFQEAGIYDKTGLNNLTTVADAQIDTSVVKYGTGSIEFDGTGDYLEAVYPSGLYDGFNDMDFTIEAWVYPNADSDDRGGIVELYTSDTNYIRLMYLPGAISGNVDFQFSGSGFDIQSGNISELAWHHVAGVSYNGTVTLYVDGTAIGSDTSYNASGVIDPRVLIGLDLVNVDRYTDGYIDDVRITKGVARYTSNFTPPTAALPKF